MKKIISIVAILLCFANTYGQQTEPTKQETMDWIASKMVKYSHNSYLNNYYSDGIVFWQSLETVKYLNNGIIEYAGIRRLGKPGDWISDTKENCKIFINLNFVFTVEKIEKEGFLNLQIKGDDIFNNQLEKENKKSNVLFLNAPHYKADGPNYFVQSLIDFDSEPDLFNRMLKAFQTLAKINNANKPKEKF